MRLSSGDPCRTIDGRIEDLERSVDIHDTPNDCTHDHLRMGSEPVTPAEGPL